MNKLNEVTRDEGTILDEVVPDYEDEAGATLYFKHREPRKQREPNVTVPVGYTREVKR